MEKLYAEAVQVRHELWSDDEDDGLADSDPYNNTGHKRMKVGDVIDSYQYDENNDLQNELLATPSGCDDNEDSEDEAARPIPDGPVFLKGKC